MIDVLNMMAKGEIKANTKLIIYDNSGECSFIYSEKDRKFFNKYSNRLEDFRIDKHFLNLEVELIQPKEKKYLVKFNLRGLRNGREYLNLDYDKRDEHVHLNDKCETLSIQTEFTKDELQSIQPVREFLEDMEGKYELIEVNDNEDD